MKGNGERASGWLRATGWVVAFGLLAGSSLLAQLSRFAKARNVKFPERYESQGPGQTNRLKGLLMADQGQYLSNELFQLTTMSLEYYQWDGRTSVVARAPECLFDAEARVAWSTGRLDIVGMDGAFTVHGQRGFLVRMTNSTMTVSNRVRTVIRQDLLKSSRKG